MHDHTDDSRESSGRTAADAGNSTDRSVTTGRNSTDRSVTTGRNSTARSVTTSRNSGRDDDGGRSRRSILRSASALGLGGLLGTGTSTIGGSEAAAAESNDPWTFVAIPDTQNMVNGNGRDVKRARSITRWVEENVDEHNVAFVSHMGDMVFNANNDDHWPRIEEVMSPLDGLVPWSPNVGNHDYYHGNDKDSGAERFKEHFGESRFEGRDYFGGAGPQGKSFYQYFSAGGYDFLHLSLEYNPENGHQPENSDLPFGWANDVLEQHPDLPTIVTTHAYLRDEETGIAGTGTQIRDNLVQPNSQVFMVLCGHVPTENHLVDSNDAGEDVYTILNDFQHREYGGNGWFRRIRFVPGGGTDAADRIQVKTYSHWLEEYERDADSEYHFDLDFEERFGDGSGGGGGGGGGTTQAPYQGPHPVPGTVEAEHFDTGGEGVAYHDTTDDHYGGDYRSDESVDVKPASEHDYTVGWIEDGEWLEYTVEVDSDGDYDLAARVASGADGGSLSVSAEGETVSTSFDGTDGWDSWTTVDLGTLSLSAGETVVRVDATDSIWNFNYLEFEAVTGDSEGLHVVDDTTARVVWKPDFDVAWNNYVYLGAAVDDEPREWQLMDETTANVFETTLGDLSAGDVIDYQFAYWANDAWQYTDTLTGTFDPVGSSGPETNKLVHGEGDELGSGEYLESANGDYRLYFQEADGNVVLRDTTTGDAQWATMTNGDGATRLTLQGDGNLVVYTDGSDPVWASNTAGSSADELVLEDDGVLVLHDGDSQVWAVNE